MKESNRCFKDYLNKLKVNELNKIYEDYKLICKIYDYKIIDVKKNKKELIEAINNYKDNYVKGVLSLLSEKDYNSLIILLKNNNIDMLNEYRDLINYLSKMHIIWLSDNLEIPCDINLKSIVRNISQNVKKSDYLYTLVDGIIIAYGVVDINYLDNLIKIDNYISMLKFNYKKEYIIDDTKLVSNKLSNKKKIDKYYKDKNYNKFSLKEFILLGKSMYHHNIKSYKKFIKMLKNNYVFSNKDIEFIDKNIVIPYLYNSINEEEVAYKNLENTISKLFEFKGNKLKDKMLHEIVFIRNYFPLWELRGHEKRGENEKGI